VPSFDPARLKEWRQQRVLSQSDLAELASVTQKTVASLELGRQVPHASTIRRLAKALKISPQELLRDDSL
jgi:transcriptional regulator with XRE-family HTH domain